MKKKFGLMMSIVLMASSGFAADDLVPATSEDIAQFDRQLSAQQNAKSAKAPTKDAQAAKVKKENFGQVVSAEAKKMKESDAKSDFGKWVSSQKKKSDQGRPDVSGAGGGKGASGGGAGADNQTGPGSGGGGQGNGHGNGKDKDKKK